MSEQPIQGWFVGIPEKTLLSKQWRALQATTRCVYTAMLLRYKRKGKEANGQVTWAQTELADITGLSVRTVKRGTQELRSKDWITIWEAGGRWAKGTTYDVNPVYANGETPKPT